jgi:hypothetical protein
VSTTPARSPEERPRFLEPLFLDARTIQRTDLFEQPVGGDAMSAERKLPPGRGP